jgi:hypothetical protein
LFLRLRLPSYIWKPLQPTFGTVFILWIGFIFLWIIISVVIIFIFLRLLFFLYFFFHKFCFFILHFSLKHLIEFLFF